MAVIEERNLGAIYKPSSSSSYKATTTTTTTYVPPTYKTTYSPGFSQSYYTPSTYVYIAPVSYYSNTVLVAGGPNFYTSRGYVTYTSSSNMGGLIGGIVGSVIFLLCLCIFCYYLCCRSKNDKYADDNPEFDSEAGID